MESDALLEEIEQMETENINTVTVLDETKQNQCSVGTQTIYTAVSKHVL